MSNWLVVISVVMWSCAQLRGWLRSNGVWQLHLSPIQRVSGHGVLPVFWWAERCPRSANREPNSYASSCMHEPHASCSAGDHSSSDLNPLMLLYGYLVQL